MTVIGGFGNAEDATMIVVMTPEDATTIVVLGVIILINHLHDDCHHSHRLHHRHRDCHQLFLLYISNVALGTIGNAEDAVMILIMAVVILFIVIRMISMISASAALVMQRMLR